jgi:hypothetical protein
MPFAMQQPDLSGHRIYLLDPEVLFGHKRKMGIEKILELLF